MRRSHQKELIDLGEDHFSRQEYFDCLYKLSKVGKWLGGDRATWKGIEGLNVTPKSILDVGCGGGYFTKDLARRFPKAQVVGVDFSKDAIAFAKQEHQQQRNLVFKEGGFPEGENQFDLVVSTLVCHHVPIDELAGFFDAAFRVCKHGVVFNDLHRHLIAYAFFKALSKPLFKNRLISHDGALSIRRGFVTRDWTEILSKVECGKHHWRVSRFFPYRWIVTCKKSPTSF